MDALAAADGIDDPEGHSRALITLLPQLPQHMQSEVLSDALADVQELREYQPPSGSWGRGYLDRYCSWAFAALIPYSPEDSRLQFLADVFDWTCRISDEGLRAGAIARLAPYLPRDLLCKALVTADKLASERDRFTALSALADYLPEDLLAEALSMTRRINDGTLRVMITAKLVPRFAPDLQERSLADALTNALSIDNAGERLRALMSLLALVPQHLRAGVLANTLATAHEIGYQSMPASVLIDLAPHLAPELREQALGEVLAKLRSGFGGTRAWSLAALALLLAPDLREQVWGEALDAALLEPISDQSTRAAVLADLVPDLPSHLLAKALDFARRIGDERDRTLALVALAPQLPPDFSIKALEAVQKLGGTDALASLLPGSGTSWGQSQMHRNSDFLASLIQHLPPNALRHILETARNMVSEEARSQVVAALAPHLPADLLPEAFSVALQIQWDEKRWAAVTSLAPRLPPNLVIQALDSVRQRDDPYSACRESGNSMLSS